MSKVVFFGSSRLSESSAGYQEVRESGALLASCGCTIVSGGYGGVMKASCEGAKRVGGRTLAFTLHDRSEELINEYVDEFIPAPGYLSRLEMLVSAGDAYIAFEGGSGTFLEIAALIALMQRNYIRKRPLYCVGEQWYETLQTATFYSVEMLDTDDFVVFTDTAQEAVHAIKKHLHLDQNGAV